MTRPRGKTIRWRFKYDILGLDVPKPYFSKTKVIVGIPAKNEEKTIGKVIKKVKKYTDWVYVFDDGSSDMTSIIAKKSGAEVILNPFNLGKGETVRYALRWFLDNKILKIHDIIIFIDADDQHDADFIPFFLEEMKKNDVDMVVGLRNISNYPFHKRLGNILLNKISSILSGLEIKDSESGFRVFNYEMAINIIRYASSKRYGIEMESNIICGRTKCKLSYVPIESKYAGEKGTTIKDGIINLISGIICLGKILLEKR